MSICLSVADFPPGPELDALVHKALWHKEADQHEMLAYSTDIEAAFKVIAIEFERGECIQLGQDIDGKWIAGSSKWTNGGEYGPRIWDDTAFRPSYKGLTAAHAVSIMVAAMWDFEERFIDMEWDPMKALHHFDDSQEGT